MTDLLVALFGFFVLYQIAVLVLPLLLRGACQLRRLTEGQQAGLLLVLTPLTAVIGTLICILPHAFGGMTGAYHATRDVDAALPGSPSGLVVATLCVLGLRVLLRAGHELWISIHLLRHRCVCDSRLRQKLRAVEARVGRVRLHWTLHASPRFSAPFLRGALAPRVFLHRELVERLTAEQLSAIFLHETGHWYHWDHVLAWLYSLVLAPLSFSNRVRDRYRAWRVSREYACDDHAGMRLGSRRLVAEAIVEVLRWQVDLRAPSSAVAFCCSDDLRSRVERLLVIDERNTEPRQTLNLGRLAGGLVLACMTVGWVSWMFPQGGLIVYCLLEHAVGMHCVV